jgi:PAS domain S-box-containing protein
MNTGQPKSGQPLGTREAMLETVLQSTADGIIVVGQSGEILTVNERFFQICRIPEHLCRSRTTEGLVEHTLGTLAHPQAFQAEIERLNRSDEESWNVIELADGRFMEAYSRPVVLGAIRGRLWSLRDITERKRMEIELSESQAYNRCLFADSSIPLGVLDPATGCFTDCNAAAVGLYRFRSRGEVLGKTPLDVSAEIQYDGTPSRTAAPEHIRLGLEKGSHRFEWRHRSPDGKIWDGEVQLMRFAYLNHDYLQFSVQDITERRRAQRRALLTGKLNENLLLPGSLTEKMQLFTDAIVDILEVDCARIWLANPGDRCAAGCVHARTADGPHACSNRQRCLHLIAGTGRNPHLDGELHARVPMGCYPIGAVAAREEPCLVTGEAVTDPHIHDRDWARSLGLPCFAGFRLRATDGSTAGVLALFGRRPLSAEEKALVESLANTASLVSQTAQAMETLRRS